MKLKKEQIDKFYMGPLTKFLFIPLAVVSNVGMVYTIVIKDTEGVIAGALFVACSIAATILSYFNDLRRNK